MKPAKFLLILTALLVFSSCSKDDSNGIGTLTVSFKTKDNNRGVSVYTLDNYSNPSYRYAILNKSAKEKNTSIKLNAGDYIIRPFIYTDNGGISHAGYTEAAFQIREDKTTKITYKSEKNVSVDY